MSRSYPKVPEWVPIVLRLPWRAPPGIVLAGLAALVAQHGLLQRPLGLTRPAEITLGIVMVAVILWLTEAVPLFVTSLVVLVLELVWLSPWLVDVQGTSLFLNAFFSDVTLLFLGGFVLSAAIERTGLDLHLSRWILRRAGTSPRRVLLAIMLTTSVLGVWMSNTAACALMLGPVAALIKQVPRGDPFRKALLLGVAFSANLGGLATPVSSPPNAIVMRYLEAKGNPPSFGVWMALGVPLLVVLQGILLLYLARRYPAEVETIAFDEARLPAFERAQAVVLGVFLLTVVGWILGGSLGVSAGTVALFPVVVFFGTNLLRTAEIRSVPWEVILLIGGGLALGAAVDQSGLAAWAGAHLPVGAVSEFVLKGVLAVLTVGISSIMSNTAAVNLLAPIITGLAGVEHAPLLLITALACTLSMPLPVSTPPNAMAYGFSVEADGRGEFTAMDMIVPGTVMTLVGLAVLALFGAVWLPLFGL